MISFFVSVIFLVMLTWFYTERNITPSGTLFLFYYYFNFFIRSLHNQIWNLQIKKLEYFLLLKHSKITEKNVYNLLLKPLISLLRLSTVESTADPPNMTN
jgi:hypothetical protein